MACALITAPTFPLLETRLLHDLQKAGIENPLTPQWVVVPSATNANHLRVRLAQTADQSVFAGTRVVNLPRLAERLSTALLHRPAPAWHCLLDLTLFEFVEQLPANSPLANLRQIRGSPALLRPAFTDLAEGGFGIDELWKIEELADTRDLSGHEQALLRLYAQWVKALEQRQINWAPLTLQSLPDRIAEATNDQLDSALAAEPGQPVRLFVYGFYEWLDVHLEWLAALARRVPISLYYPHQAQHGRSHPAFSFTDSVLADLRMRFDSPAEEPVTSESGDTAAFFLQTFPEGPVPAQAPSFLGFQMASGIRAEAIAAALRVRRWLDDDRLSLQPQDIAVVAPSAEDYAESVAEVFQAFAIPLRVSDVPAGPAPAVEPLRMLARIWEEQAPAEWVLALLRAAPGIPAAAQVDVNRFESKVRELGIWGGSAWQAALERQELEGARSEDADRHPIAFDAAEKKLIERLLFFVPADEAVPPQRLSVTDALRVLRHLAETWLPEPDALAPLVEAAEAAERETPHLLIDRGQWTRWLAGSAALPGQRDPLSPSVSFLPLMRARGLTTRALVVLGLAAGQMPRRLDDDPLLSETAALRIAAVAAQIGHRLPLKARVTEEMLLLFFLLNTSAEHLHWVVPETDAAGKAVAPTPWVQRYLQRWSPRRQHDSAPDPFARRIARSPFRQAQDLAELDPDSGRYLPPALALYLDPKLAGEESAGSAFLVDAGAKRGRDPLWSGGIGQQPAFRRNHIGVTRLEALARCPFRFYAQAVAGWNPLETLSLTHSLDPRTRGTLLHQLLEHSVKPWLRNKSLREISPILLQDNARELNQLAARLTATDPDATLALAMLPPVFRDAARREVVSLAAAYFAWAGQTDAVPQAVEQEFSREFPGLEGLMIIGKIDRLDDTDQGIELTDFKTGRYPAEYRKLVRRGWQIQAALYPWLCGQSAAAFRYVFLGQLEVKVGDTKEAPAAESLLAELAPILRQGAFVPTSNEVVEELGVEDATPCRHCHWVSACRRFEPGAARLHAALFAALAPDRVRSLRAGAPAPPQPAVPAAVKPRRGRTP